MRVSTPSFVPTIRPKTLLAAAGALFAGAGAALGEAEFIAEATCFTLVAHEPAVAVSVEADFAESRTELGSAFASTDAVFLELPAEFVAGAGAEGEASAPGGDAFGTTSVRYIVTLQNTGPAEEPIRVTLDYDLFTSAGAFGFGETAEAEASFRVTSEPLGIDVERSITSGAQAGVEIIDVELGPEEIQLLEIELVAAGEASSPNCAADLNDDGVVDSADLQVVLAGFGQEVGPGVGGDVDRDGVVSVADLNLLLASYGVGCG